MFYNKLKSPIILLFFLNLLSNSIAIDFSYLVETIPEDLLYNQTIKSKPTYETWLSLINSANYSIDIASFYWTLLGKDVMNKPVQESLKGTYILQALVDAKKNKNITIRIAVNSDISNTHNADLEILSQYAEIRQVNFTRLIGAGILHTKFIVVDRKSFYLGSANMDWRSLTHVKELGIVVENTLLSEDLIKVFEVYWFLGNNNSTIPDFWPKSFTTNFNMQHPLNISFNNINENYEVFLTSSPKQLCPNGRTNDIEALINIINKAERFIYIAVMDYYPLFIYQKPLKFWPVIDDALKKAAIERNVEVLLLTSRWNNTNKSMTLFLKSLSAINNENILKGSIKIKQFYLPAFTPKEKEIPFSRVNHNKYMVTDRTAYISTSNWSGDYFMNTGGVAIVLNTVSNKTLLYQQLKDIFLRDWSSSYSQIVK